jgi:ubiquinone/menaquinone biosynthesis C-methylase UbiE
MNILQPSSGIAAGIVFDQLAPDYDRDFTNSLIGRAQRNAVWKVLLNTFKPASNLLELNCGTGEDALFLARNGITVFACDASVQMISRAEQRLHNTVPTPPVVFCQLPTERLDELGSDVHFDGVFSNFSGLNCIADLSAVAASISKLVAPGDNLLLCFSTPFCLIETLYYLSRGDIKKALRRCSGKSQATLNGLPLTVFYPSLRRLRRSFAPHFDLVSVTGIGVAIPPSYLEPWARRHPFFFPILCKLEGVLATLPIFRTTGDHMLLRLRKVSP